MVWSFQRFPIFWGAIKYDIAKQPGILGSQPSLAVIPIVLFLGTATTLVKPLESMETSQMVAQAVTESDNQLRDRVQTEVDSAFRRTLALLNLVLVFLFLLPTIAGVGVWFLLSKLTDQVFRFQQEIESLQADAINQIEGSINQARNTLYQLEKNTTKADAAIESLKVQTIIQVPESETEESLGSREEDPDTVTGDGLLNGSSQESQVTNEPELSSRDRNLAAARQLAKQGEKLFLNNQLDQAITAYNEALKLDPDLAEVWNNRGVVLTKSKRYQEAIASYEKAIQIRTDYPDAWSNRGVALGKLNYYQAAVFSYDRAIQLKENYLDAWNNRGQALMNLEQYDEAIASYNQAAKIRPDFYKTWYNKARCYALKGNEDLAIENLKRAMGINPDVVRKFAQQERDFDGISKQQQFQQLVSHRRM